MNKFKLISLLIFSCSLLTACDTYPYKKKIQSGYDRGNPSGNKAICMIVGRVPLSSYPFTTYHLEGEDLPFSSDGPFVAYYNQLKNENLHYFSGLGFFTEEYVGEELGKPIYRYDLTDLGRKYFDNFRNQTNFCFGRIVVDSIDRVKDSVTNFGSKERDIDITYHVENIPDWAKNSDAYIRYRYPKEMITGEPLEGEHTYRILGKNKFKTIVGVNRGFQEATRSDEVKQ